VLFRAAQRGQEHTCEDRNDGYYDQEFDQGEADCFPVAGWFACS
jgi:hypothetical protein